MKSRLACLASLLTLVPALALAQNPLMSSVKAQHDMVKANLLKSVQLIPENLFAFQPTKDVRTIAQLFGHIADATISICGNAGGGKAAPLNAEKTMSTKAQLVKAMGDAMAACDAVIAGMDDTKGMETTKFFAGGQSTRAMIIAFNTAHSYEHYGNLVTYMRLNKIVPPSTAGN